MAVVRCPKCDAINYPRGDDAACEECGARLPRTDAYGSEPERRRDDYEEARPLRRREGDEDYPDRRVGSRDYLDVRKRDDDREEKKKKAVSEVSGILFAIAVLTLICNMIGVFALGGGGNNPPEVLAFAIAFVVGISLVFVALGIWARWMPLPAGIIGLLLYVGLVLLDFIGTAGGPGGGGSMARGIIFKILIIIGLIRAIITAAKAS